MFRNAVLIHGCHVAAEGWEFLVWGDPRNDVFGRVPKALQLAVKNNADLIFWGTGASEKNGKKESQVIFEYAIQRIHELDHLVIGGFAGFDVYEIRALLDRISFLDTVAKNTTEEIVQADIQCQERNINQLFLVSSPTHIARCFQEALKLKDSGKLVGVEVFAVASDTCYAGSVPGDVAIVEPPHRGDDPMLCASVQLHKLIPMIYKISPDKRREFLVNLKENLVASAG